MAAHALSASCIRCGFTLSAHADGYCPSNVPGPGGARFLARDHDHKPRPVVVCLCGSTRFRDAWIRAHREESLAGRIVLSVGVMIHAGDEPIRDDSPEKRALDELHLRKIDLADEVLVLNVGGYIGDSTRREVAYALDTRKPVRFLEASD